MFWQDRRGEKLQFRNLRCSLNELGFLWWVLAVICSWKAFRSLPAAVVMFNIWMLVHFLWIRVSQLRESSSAILIQLALALSSCHFDNPAFYGDFYQWHGQIGVWDLGIWALATQPFTSTKAATDCRYSWNEYSRSRRVTRTVVGVSLLLWQQKMTKRYGIVGNTFTVNSL